MISAYEKRKQMENDHRRIFRTKTTQTANDDSTMLYGEVKRIQIDENGKSGNIYEMFDRQTKDVEIIGNEETNKLSDLSITNVNNNATFSEKSRSSYCLDDQWDITSPNNSQSDDNSYETKELQMAEEQVNVHCCFEKDPGVSSLIKLYNSKGNETYSKYQYQTSFDFEENDIDIAIQSNTHSNITDIQYRNSKSPDVKVFSKNDGMILPETYPLQFPTLKMHEDNNENRYKSKQITHKYLDDNISRKSTTDSHGTLSVRKIPKSQIEILSDNGTIIRKKMKNDRRSLKSRLFDTPDHPKTEDFSISSKKSSKSEKGRAPSPPLHLSIGRNKKISKTLSPNEKFREAPPKPATDRQTAPQPPRTIMTSEDNMTSDDNHERIIETVVEPKIIKIVTNEKTVENVYEVDNWVVEHEKRTSLETPSIPHKNDKDHRHIPIDTPTESKLKIFLSNLKEKRSRNQSESSRLSTSPKRDRSLEGSENSKTPNSINLNDGKYSSSNHHRNDVEENWKKKKDRSFLPKSLKLKPSSPNTIKSDEKDNDNEYYRQKSISSADSHRVRMTVYSSNDHHVPIPITTNSIISNTHQDLMREIQASTNIVNSIDSKGPRRSPTNSYNKNSYHRYNVDNNKFNDSTLSSHTTPSHMSSSTSSSSTTTSSDNEMDRYDHHNYQYPERDIDLNTSHKINDITDNAHHTISPVSDRDRNDSDPFSNKQINRFDDHYSKNQEWNHNRTDRHINVSDEKKDQIQSNVHNIRKAFEHQYDENQKKFLKNEYHENSRKISENQNDENSRKISENQNDEKSRKSSENYKDGNGKKVSENYNDGNTKKIFENYNGNFRKISENENDGISRKNSKNENDRDSRKTAENRYQNDYSTKHDFDYRYDGNSGKNSESQSRRNSRKNSENDDGNSRRHFESRNENSWKSMDNNLSNNENYQINDRTDHQSKHDERNLPKADVRKVHHSEKRTYKPNQNYHHINDLNIDNNGYKSRKNYSNGKFAATSPQNQNLLVTSRDRMQQDSNYLMSEVNYRSSISPRHTTIQRSVPRMSNYTYSTQYSSNMGGGVGGISNSLARMGLPGAPSSAVIAIKEGRDREKRELSQLNDRFASYIERVRFLEAQNKKLQLELEALKGKWGNETSKIHEIFETELKEARQLVDDTAKERANAELRAKRAEEETAQFKRRYEEALAGRDADKDRIYQLEQQIAKNEAEINLLRRRLADVDEEIKRYKAETQRLLSELQRLGSELDNETLARVQLENERQTLEEELSFIKQIHEQELNELRALSARDTGIDSSQYFKHELANAIKDIRDEYEQANLQQRAEMESYYRMKTQELLAPRMPPDNPIQREEVKKLRVQVNDYRRDLSSLKTKNAELEARMHELEELIENEKREGGTMITEKEVELEDLKRQLADLMKNYDDLINMKTTLEQEITTYRRLLEGDQTKDGLRQIVEGLEDRARQASAAAITAGGGGGGAASSTYYTNTSGGGGGSEYMKRTTITREHHGKRY
ncbi:hypothetical protein SNEBB_004565 [Seison nebaliae]|nr:hypothetical protein SNEBB_004565 [Seison nebaliae]